MFDIIPVDENHRLGGWVGFFQSLDLPQNARMIGDCIDNRQEGPVAGNGKLRNFLRLEPVATEPISRIGQHLPQPFAEQSIRLKEQSGHVRRR